MLSLTPHQWPIYSHRTVIHSSLLYPVLHDLPSNLAQIRELGEGSG
jgi:hypothetical protein